MTNKDFNKKYRLSAALVQSSLKYSQQNSSEIFNNVAGKPKKLVIEIFKRFFSNWVTVLSTIILLTVLITSIVVTTTSPYSGEKTFVNDIHYKTLNGTVSVGPEARNVSFLPPKWYGFTKPSGQFTREIAIEFISRIKKSDYYGGQIYDIIADPIFKNGKEISNNLFKILRDESGKIILDSSNQPTILINRYVYYKAFAVSQLLSLDKIPTQGYTDVKYHSLVEELLKINNNFNLNTFLGTNKAGVDIWTNSWLGTWNAIRLALIVATIQTIIGVAVGAYLGFHAGTLLDTIIMRLIDIFVAPPTLIWLLLFASVFGTSDLTLGLALIFVGWTGSVGGTRMFIITVKDEEYISASKSIGASKSRLIYSHALPAILGKIATSYVASIPSIILSVASLAFLGFFQGDTANLGSILSNASQEATENVWILLLPALILLSISVSLHFVALGVHDALDPKVIKAK